MHQTAADLLGHCHLGIRMPLLYQILQQTNIALSETQKVLQFQLHSGENGGTDGDILLVFYLYFFDIPFNITKLLIKKSKEQQ